ncbi:MAG: helix-hairpin-helix domain-containing protein, partial [Flavobacteriales bacterium]|nr:helix-hairpin-helix domain-containing protein [Flavobacteriales bacterium]
YFQFNKKERNGILLLSCLLLLLILFYQFSHLLKQESRTDFSSFEKALAELEYEQEPTIEKQKDSLFYFNPNTLADKGWLVLGLPSTKLSVLRNFQKSGAIFKTKTDLKHCFAITDAFYEKVEKYISIPEIKKTETPINKTKKTNQIVELNQADSLQLISINGVGPFYAKQILKYRKELGGFRNYAQLTEIWGLENLEIQKLKQQTSIDTLHIRKVNVNTIELEQLKLHPYLNYKQAKMILNYRKQHGDFKQVKDIRKIKPISPELFRKIAPYLKTHD